MIFNARLLDMCSKLPTTFVPLSVLSLIRPRTNKVASTSCLSFTTSHVRKIPGSPHLHNFNVRVPERGSLGTRLYYKSTLLSGASGGIVSLDR